MNTTTSSIETTQSTQIITGLQQVRENISTFTDRYARSPNSVKLLAVSKYKPLSAIRTAIDAGQRAFGENYVDEAITKIQALDDNALEWHFIGAIQSRKTASIAEHFQWAHGVDRLKIARRLADQRPRHLPPLNICLQVNTDNEEAKAGVRFDEVRQLARDCEPLTGIRLRGLMAIPAPRSELAQQREVFAQLRHCLQAMAADHPSMDTLSMGMSGDMEAAVAEGATIVRVGTAIFGARDKPLV